MNNQSELHIFMERLYLAGMSIEDVIARGFDFECRRRFEANVTERLLGQRLAASETVLAVARDLGISRDDQRKAG